MAGSRMSTVTDGTLRVRVLGGFAVEGIEERALGTRKARLLLKRLAVALGRPVASDELAAVVWGEELPANPSDQISVLVSRLRGVLGPDRLPRSDAGYCLAADWFDVAALELSVTETEDRLRSGETAAALAAAHVVLGLATGSLLPEEDGAWLDDVRPAADRLVARARLVAAEAAVRAGEFSAARAAAHSVLDHDPYDEAALRLVMRADTFAGRPGAALIAYAEARHRLSEDLGSDPAADTESLHTAIVRGELLAVSHALAGPAEFVGRTNELDLLDAALGRAAGREGVAIVIEAEAGLGKTALLSSWISKASLSALLLLGRCDELGRDLPLQPLIDALDTHLDSLGRQAADEVLGPDATLLDPLLARRSSKATTAATTVGDAETSRTAMFAALAAVLRRAAGPRTLVLAIDDLHQAAAGSAEFLAFALRKIPHLMVLATRRPEPGPDLPGARRITLSPLSIVDVVTLVGAERGPALHERSGGHPLFVRELADAPDDELPSSIVAAVRGQLRRLGTSAVSLEVAASCGTELDAVLVAAIAQREMPAVLDDLEAATRAGLLRPRGYALAFNHELVREAIETATSPARKREIHRAAVDELARRREVDPLALARHARLGGDAVVAASALVTAAERAKQRCELASAEGLLDQAVDLADASTARMARGRLRLARLDLEAAREDALRAIELGAGVEGFELAGWVAYYGRHYDTALRYADEGVERATSNEVRASCLALAGRIRHTRGYLSEAAVRFEEGIAVAPPGIRGMLQVWHGQLLAHQGDAEPAADLARRGLLDPYVSHPFVAGHGNFTLAYALSVAGRWSAALDAVDDLDAWIIRQGDKRFPPVAANMRGWLLRGAGLLHEAVELHHPAVAADPGPTFQEAHYAALLDLAECHLAGGHVNAAAGALDKAAEVLHWTGSMSWRHRNRYRHLAARMASLGGDHSQGADAARAVAAAAAARGDRRYKHRAILTAATIDARAGRRTDPEALGAHIEAFRPVCGPDGWRELAELAKATGSDEVWRQAQNQAATIVAEASKRVGFDADRVTRAVRNQLDQLHP
jgi:DNA-binding SARP family transcriptional activator/tetratricopeptide (TPR) repeat protein